MAEIGVDLIFGYIGTQFSGSQIQPNARTVQGEIRKAVLRLKWIKNSSPLIPMSSRTDAGVHARINLTRLRIPESLIRERGINGMLSTLDNVLDEDILPITFVKAPDSPIRHVTNREYRYFLTGIENWDYPSE